MRNLGKNVDDSKTKLYYNLFGRNANCCLSAYQTIKDATKPGWKNSPLLKRTTQKLVHNYLLNLYLTDGTKQILK